MNPDLANKWEEASRTGERVDVGRNVVCDFCDDDYTERQDAGGLIFGSKAVCPACAPKLRRDIERYGEQHYVRAECPEGQSFGDFVREYRARTGNNFIQITKGAPA